MYFLDKNISNSEHSGSKLHFMIKEMLKFLVSFGIFSEEKILLAIEKNSFYRCVERWQSK